MDDVHGKGNRVLCIFHLHDCDALLAVILPIKPDDMYCKWAIVGAKCDRSPWETTDQQSHFYAPILLMWGRYILNTVPYRVSLGYTLSLAEIPAYHHCILSGM